MAGHIDEVRRKEAEAVRESPFQCANCGATFTSLSERRKHEESAHPAGRAPAAARTLSVLPDFSRPAPSPGAAWDDLAAELRSRIQGEVRFDPGSRALYATDASNYRQTPIGVTCPRSKEDVAEILAACRRYGAAVLPRGGGTSLAGQCCNVAVVMDFTKYMYEVLDVDPGRRLARVQPGCALDDLRNAAEKYHLTFGPDPATHAHCTLGGMVGNNSCGVHSQMAGRTVDNIEELEILTSDGAYMRVGRTPEDELESIIRQGGRRGEIYAGLKSIRDRYAGLIRKRFPEIPRRVSGYSLDQLLPENGFHVGRALVGSEGTCVTVLEVTANLVHSPPHRAIAVLGYPDVYSAGDHVPGVVAHGPIGCEGIDGELVGYYKRKGTFLEEIRLLPEGAAWLLAEFGGDTREEAAGRARAMMDELRRAPDAPSMRLLKDTFEQEQLWLVRESGLGATAWVPGEPATWPGWEDSAVHPDRMGDYLRELRRLFDKYGYRASLYGHFGQGCIHCRIPFDLTSREGLDRYRAFVNEAADAVVRFGGSISGEHGDGQSRAELLGKMYGEELVQAFREFKSLWDPDWRMNPGKLVQPYSITENLRLGAGYRQPRPQTHFQFPDDGGDFAKAALRCVGVGKCRRESGGTMCPSYMVTREEKHSTRGRARLLFEMLRGDPLGEGWRSEHVMEALELCLSCKGCKSDCPVAVDMATYKAEFVSHYYEGRLRPRQAYSMGLIYWWARLASLMPGLANLLAKAPLVSSIAKFAAGLAPERRVPEFASETFTSWFRKRTGPSTGRRVMLWPDTFTNHFHPEIAKAAVEVLEDAGFEVAIPGRSLCCGRPLYDFGMLDLAKRQLRQILHELAPEIDAGTPLIGLEPSCTAVFRDELPNLFPNDERAKRLASQTLLLSEFLDQKADGYRLPELRRKIVVHGHCHQKALMTMRSEERLLSRMGADYEVLDSGCCGMAGSFGFERGERYDVSIKCGLRSLIPAVRQAEADSVILADGFSCREQIAQTTTRRGMHVAQLLQMALRESRGGPATGNYPEREYPAGRPAAAGLGTAAVLGGVALLAGAAAWWLSRGRK